MFLVLYVLLHHQWQWGMREAVTKITPTWPVLPFCIILTCQTGLLRAMGTRRGPIRTILKPCISFIVSLWEPGAQRWLDSCLGPQEPPSSQAAQSGKIYVYWVLHIPLRLDFEQQNTRIHEVKNRRMVGGIWSALLWFFHEFIFKIWASLSKFTLLTLL